jgi:methylthioribose-1-phosphate isomerase
MISPIEWLDNKVKILDQTKLPEKMVYFETSDYHDVISAIKDLRVRGAPAIGVAAAYGIALGALKIRAKTKEAFLSELDNITRAFAATRPTAVNLFKTIQKMERLAREEEYVESLQPLLVAVAKNIHAEEKGASQRLSQFGTELIKDNFTILTHCNTGALATAASGSALGVIFAAKERGMNIHVIADETRPLLQGARLTMLELLDANVPATLIVDSAAGYFMKSGKVNCVIVGADRIAANGDTANKIGTYMLAVLAHENNIPFYVAAPVSTIDLAILSGSEIKIEERDPSEVTNWKDIRFPPEGIQAANPAFDVTPNTYVTAIITDKGVARQPYARSLGQLMEEK